jgi:hypothetical protein
MSTTSLRRLAWAVFAVTVALFVVGIALAPTPADQSNTSDWELSELGAYLFVVAMLSFTAVGVLIAVRLPRNAIGWLLLAIGFSWGLVVVADGYVIRAVELSPGSLPNPSLVAAMSGWLWVPPIGLMGNYLILLFPDGHLPSPRWRPVAWISAGALLLSSIAIVFYPGSLADVGLPGETNPLGVESLERVLDALQLTIALIPITIVASAVALVGRFRRSRAEERLQLKWLTAAGGTVACLYLAAMAGSLTYAFSDSNADPLWAQVLDQVALVSFGLIPVAIGVAILKHRLYDIDLIINRTLVYGALTALLATTYFGMVVLLQGVIPAASDSDLTIAGSTLAVAALFRPLRARVQGFIDRRFYRRRYDAQRTLETFTQTLREKVDLEALSRELVGVVDRTMEPTQVSLWLRPVASPSIHVGRT